MNSERGMRNAEVPGIRIPEFSVKLAWLTIVKGGWILSFLDLYLHEQKKGSALLAITKSEHGIQLQLLWLGLIGKYIWFSKSRKTGRWRFVGQPDLSC